MKQALLLGYGLLAFWTGLYAARKLYEPAIQEVTQKHYECTYLKDQATHLQIQTQERAQATQLSLEDTRQMLATCKRVLEFADDKTACPEPEPEPPKPKKRKRWKRR